MRWICWLCPAVVVFAQGGTTPKQKPEDYEVHAQARNAAIGAEYMVHSFSRGQESYIAKDYLVVEVALFPPKGQPIEATAGAFRLRVNGKKDPLIPAAPQMVAASLQHPEWRDDPSLQAGAGVGNTTVSVGGPPRNNNPFPGSVPPGREPIPVPPRPDGGNLPGMDPPQRVKPEQLVVETALPEGSHQGAISGFVYFPYAGKIKSIQSLELLYEDMVLKLK